MVTKKMLSIVGILFANQISAHSVIEYKELVLHNTRETLNLIADIISHRKKGGYMRFGDGDVNLANGQGELMQRPTITLMTEMREAFALNHSNVLKTLPLHCKEFDAYEPFMSPGNHETDLPWCIRLLNRAKPFWGAVITDVYSPASLPYLASYFPDECIEFLKFLKAQKCCVLVGDRNIPQSIRTLLFGTHCQFVPTPERNSYYEIDRIEKECLEKISTTSEYKVVIISMGCSGRVLQKRLWHKIDNVFFFDFGSLMDALYGNNSRAWMDVAKFNNKAFLTRLLNEL